ncbi:MAG: hypothetical protein GXP52_05575 [Deltaproteobacteria bacterium]|nr:hypothetical protein [Deltaproteobacteria bacterium]
MNRVIRITIVLAMSLLVLPGAGKAGPLRNTGQWRVMELPTTGNWFEGRAGYRPGFALGRGSAFGKGRYSIYLLELAPGSSYTLGLRYSSGVKNKPSVLLYDRWPLDPSARRYKLPVGPVMRTDPGKIEYRWRLSVSGRSRGNLAFVVVQAGAGIAGAKGRFRHFMYLTTPAVQPKNRLGTGITYLRGPSDLMLGEPSPDIQYLVEYPFSRAGNRGDREHRVAGELIDNGDFSRGLRHWELFSGNGESGDSGRVSVGNEGLRLGNEDTGDIAGVRQTVKWYVGDIHSLVLAAGLRIDRGKSGRFQQVDDPPVLQIAVCYADEEKREHCADDAYIREFTTDGGAQSNARFTRVENGRWHNFEDDLMGLSPRPDVIESVSITGLGLKNSEAWVQSISLVAR